jgi:methyl-accepting chemotaxis protein
MVKEEGDKVYNVGEIMSDILDEAHDSALMTRTIERATEEQVKSLVQVERSMMDISNMASGVSKAMEEQITGSGYMLERVGEVREVADLMKKGTDEQANATNSISRNSEMANEKLALINSAITGQHQVSDGILLSIDEIRHTGIENIRNMEDVSKSLDVLLKEIELLKKEMEVFRI